MSLSDAPHVCEEGLSRILDCGGGVGKAIGEVSIGLVRSDHLYLILSMTHSVKVTRDVG